ncbi:MAG: putative Ig domain-containing protein [Verrucomicrobia bacterium]|nr:putative Ig domain-containing protein [Verrucomicrobiota bacterium]
MITIRNLMTFTASPCSHGPLPMRSATSQRQKRSLLAIAVAALTLGHAAAVPLPANCVSWWRAENTFADSVGTNHGTGLNGVTYAAGEVGQAWSFDGTDDSIQVPSSANLNLVSGQGWTLEGWIKPEDTSTRFIAHKGSQTSGGDQYWQVYLNGNALRFEMVSNAGYDSVISSTTMVTGQWQHFAVVVDNMGGPISGYHLYLNGTDAGTSYTHDGASSGTVNNTEPLRIGAVNAYGSLSDFLKGQLDELAIYNRALSANEIAAIHAAGAGGKVLPGTPPAITSASPPAAGTVGTTYHHTCTASGSTPITFTVSAGALPTGLILSSSGEITGTPNTAGTFTGTITAANGSLPDATQSFSIVIAPATAAPLFTSAAPTATGQVGTPYHHTCTASGTTPITFTVSTGALPTGLTLSSSGVISGTPDTTGTFTGTITAANGTLPNATQNFSIGVAPAPEPPPVVSIEYVSVGNAGNAADTVDGDNFETGMQNLGAVGYAYQIGKYEVTNSQYVVFLNAADPSGANPNGIYNPGMGSDPMGGIRLEIDAANGTKYQLRPNMENKPVNFVSWYDAARFANWLHNGQGAGSTETGAYTLSGNTGFTAKNAGATVYLPSQDEWYKAAYFNPANSTYSLYPTQSNTAPTLGIANATGAITNPGTNVANYNKGADWNGMDGNVTTVGSAGANSVSYYGTFDQGGNVWEWNDAVKFGDSRGSRGGSYWDGPNLLKSTYGSNNVPALETDGVGFRVVSINPALVAPLFTSTTPVSTGRVGSAYNHSCAASGSTPITFTVSTGALPTGLTLSSNGVISGTPDATGTFTGTITAANGTLPNATQDFSIVISEFHTLVTGGTHGTVTGGGNYLHGASATLTATGNPGYLFAGWTGDATGTTNPLAVQMTADKSITATFTPDTNDTDGDGLTNYQEIVGYHTNPEVADTDGDGFSDGYEVNGGFNPASADSAPDRQMNIYTSVELEFGAGLGKTYRVESSTDLTAWTTVESGIVGTGGMITRLYSIRAIPHRYFRAVRE